MRASKELKLLLWLTGDIYRQPAMQRRPETDGIDWGRFLRLTKRNKILYYTACKLLEKTQLSLEPAVAERIKQIKEHEESHVAMLPRTIAAINADLGDEPYLLYKTYRPFTYVTHDADIIIRDRVKAKALFEAGGKQPRSMVDPKPLWFPDEEGLLEIEGYERVLPGPMQFMDDDFLWANTQEVVIAGEKTRLPSIEVEIMTFLAEWGFRLYEILLGDLLYVFSLAEDADWRAMSKQAAKYGWHKQFAGETAILNGFHRALYGEAGPIEKQLPGSAGVKLDFPCVMTFLHVARGLNRMGTKNLLKLPAYWSVRLKKYPGLHRLYVKTFMDTLSRPLVKYIYH